MNETDPDSRDKRDIKEEMKHLRELYNARVNKLSWDILATMNSDTTSKAKLQKHYKPTEAVALPRMSWPANARNTKRNLSDNYLAPEFRETFEQVAKATIQEVHRARYKSLGRIVPSQRMNQSPARSEREEDGLPRTGRSGNE